MDYSLRDCIGLAPNQEIVKVGRIRTNTERSFNQPQLHRVQMQNTSHAVMAQRWTLPQAELQTIEDSYYQFEPQDKLLRIKWLFDDHHAPILQPKNARDWEANSNASDKERREALANLVCEAGVAAVRDLYLIVRLPSLVGRAFAQNNEAANFPAEFIEALKTDSGADWDFAHGGLFAYYEKRGDAWADNILDQALKEKWGDLALGRILLSLPKSEHFIERATKIGGPVEATYWEKLVIFQINVPPAARPRVVERLLQANRAWATVQFAGQHVLDIPSDLLVRVLNEALSDQPKNPTDGNDGTMFQHYVVLIFDKLDHDPSVTEDQVARLEWSYLKILEYSNRTPKALPKLLATSPEFFLQVLSTAYRGENEKGLDETAEDYEVQKSMAGQAWALLHSWSHVPGLSDDGNAINGAKLEAWVREARILCKKADRAAIGDQIIGQVLAHAPADNHGVWPCEEIRELFEVTRSKDLEAGIQTGVYNKRGVTTRLPTDGGAQEREIAARYREWSEKTQLEFPRTGAMLAAIAKTYDWDAKHHDDDADIQQW